MSFLNSGEYGIEHSPRFLEKEIIEKLSDELKRKKKYFTPDQIQSKNTFSVKNDQIKLVFQLKVKGSKLKEIFIHPVKNYTTSSFSKDTLELIGLKDENVVKVIGMVFLTNEKPCLILPYRKEITLLDYVKSDPTIPVRPLVKFMLNIASGMKYLTSKKECVHQDLSARNCLIDDKKNIRITGFSLFKTWYGEKADKSTCRQSLRWMAPETLKSLDHEATFTTKSDVWSYAVTAWELFSKGLPPYKDVDDDDLVKVLDQGVLLEKPSSCNRIIYDLWKQCWSLDPELRPTFGQIVKKIDETQGGLGTPIINTCFDEELLDKLSESNKIFSYKNLKIENPIGSGAFGIVKKGKLTLNDSKKVKVAVKIFYDAQCDSNALLKEGLTMVGLQHENVMSLIGLVIPQNGGPQLIFPYMKNGNLLDHVRKGPGKSKKPCIRQWILFAFDISLGMQYLAGQKFVHRDLAARNCMLDDNFRVCVADFGLTRDIYEKGYYRQISEGLQPMKWMAPESLKEQVFTTKSDVWSYAVTLWEIFSR